MDLQIPNFTKIEELWKLRVQILLSPSVKYGFWYVDFHQNQICWTSLRVGLKYRLKSASEKKSEEYG